MRTLDFSGLASPPRVSVLGETASVFYARHWLNQIGIETSTAEDSQVIVEEIIIFVNIVVTKQSQLIILFQNQKGDNTNGRMLLHAVKNVIL